MDKGLIGISGKEAMSIIGHAADGAAAAHAFNDYLSRKAPNTVKAHRAALAIFIDYLKAAGANGKTVDQLQHEPAAWQGMSWGIVEGWNPPQAMGTPGSAICSARVACTVTSNIVVRKDIPMKSAS